MKRFLLFISIIFSISSYSQGYGILGTSAFYENKHLNNSISFGAGYKMNKYSAGFVADFYGVDNAKGRFAIPALDIRGYVGDFYASVQPGYVLYSENKEGVKAKGSVAGSVMIGYEIKKGEVGLNAAAGYQYTSFMVNNDRTNSNAIKLSVYLRI